jgi:hypothetical protein
MIPENNGAPEAKAIPKHKGTATKNTTILAGKSFLSSFNNFCFSTVCLILSKDSNTIINNCKTFISLSNNSCQTNQIIDNQYINLQNGILFKYKNE